MQNYLYMEEDGGVVAILLDNVKDVLKHPGTNPQPSVGRQTPQCHYVQLGQKGYKRLDTKCH